MLGSVYLKHTINKLLSFKYFKQLEVAFWTIRISKLLLVTEIYIDMIDNNLPWNALLKHSGYLIIFMLACCSSVECAVTI